MTLVQIQKEHKHAQAQRIPRSAAGAAFGNPAHLLDAAHHVQCAWDEATSTTISNAWRKAEIIETLEEDKEEDAEELDDVMFDKILQKLSTFGITEQEMNEFLNSDNEYIESIMEDVNKMLTLKAAMMKPKQCKSMMMKNFFHWI